MEKDVVNVSAYFLVPSWEFGFGGHSIGVHGLVPLDQEYSLGLLDLPYGGKVSVSRYDGEDALGSVCQFCKGVYTEHMLIKFVSGSSRVLCPGDVLVFNSLGIETWKEAAMYDSFIYTPIPCNLSLFNDMEVRSAIVKPYGIADDSPMTTG